ncbi:hypothetical protein CDAR_51271 [Caerostris darwini]|uniref:Uncharacterized protein n=1 Tax=Caerostris darwini TaxID=1538125 RepID=A0AAV4U658_9ARAC|nr:hypothetical protein CDAR_51271 [Caerostris darwini]
MPPLYAKQFQQNLLFPIIVLHPRRSQLIRSCPSALRKSKTRTFHKNYRLVSKYRTLPNILPHPLSLSKGDRIVGGIPRRTISEDPYSHFQIGNEAQLFLNVDDSPAENSIHPFHRRPPAKFEINREKEIASLLASRTQSPIRAFLREVWGTFSLPFLKKGGGGAIFKVEAELR